MEDIFDIFKAIIGKIDGLLSQEDLHDKIDELKMGLHEVYSGLKDSGSKMFSAASFIDFFVHDIMDYTVLNKEEANFEKNEEVFNVKQAIEETVGIQADKIKLKQIKIETFYRGFPDNPWINTDKKRLQQVLLNLLTNSIKFTDRKGNILILVDYIPEEEGQIAMVSDFFRQPMVKVSVIDSGAGIKSKNKHKLFKLGTDKLSTQGIGIGLVICKLIVKKFGGTIDFASKSKKGSCFQFTFKTQPIAMTDLLHYQERHREIPIQEEIILKTKVINPPNIESFMAVTDHLMQFQNFQASRILVVDDEEFCLNSMRALLAKAGVDVQYQADFCITGEEALQYVKRAHNLGFKYKLIFTDFSMPVMDGIESTRQIRHFLTSQQVAAQFQPRIIGITGHVHQQFCQNGMKAGMDEVVAKPIYFKVLQNILT